MIKSRAFRVCAVAIAGASVSGGAALAQCGTASWYHEGSRTATGERYNPDGISAAHRSLPFGTRVKVTHKRTGRSVVVRINDRGPFIRGRIIDLSRGAKRVIGMGGLAPVCLTVLGRGERYASAKTERKKRVATASQRLPRAVSGKARSRLAEEKRIQAADNAEPDTAGVRVYRSETGRSFKLANWPSTADSDL
jgi:rare lipoprotein A